MSFDYNLPLFYPQVITLTKEHALYLWIHVKGSADAKTCAKVAANVQKYVDCIIPPKEADENDEVWAGVAFGPSFYAKVQLLLCILILYSTLTN